MIFLLEVKFFLKSNAELWLLVKYLNIRDIILFLSTVFHIAMHKLFSISERYKERSTRPSININCEIQSQ